jgi:hypothetical protein
MVGVGRLAGDAQADQPHDVGGRVGERVETVGDDADGAGGVAQNQLRPGDRQVEEQDTNENAGNAA